MRILLTADTVGGVWHYALALAAGLRDRAEVAVASMGAALTREQRMAAEATGARVYANDLKLEWMDNPWDDVARAGRWLLDVEREWQPDVVTSSQYAFGALDWRAPVLVVAHSCVYSWWQAVHGKRPPSSWRRYHRVVSAGLAAADDIAAPTRSMLEATKRHYGHGHKGHVIYNGKDPLRLNVPRRRKKTVFFCAGRLWDEGKNVRVLDEAAADLSWPVYIAGDGQSPDGRRQCCRHAHGLGQLPAAEVADWMARAAVYVHPAKYEPFGLAPLEAGQAGCALVLADIPSLREVWGDAALYVSPSDAALLRTTLQRLETDPDLVQAYGARARERASLYGARCMVENYWALYQQLAKCGRHAALAANG